MVKQVIKKTIKVGKHTIDISNEKKIIFPQDDITKGQLIDYYRRIAPTMVPHLRSRPLTMQRFPNGITSEGFFQKDASDYFPSWIPTKAVKRKEGGMVHYVVCNDAATLVYLANQLCITPHVWLSTVNALRYPDRMIFDLDPSGTDFSVVMYVAHQLKKILEKQKLVPFVMTTGSRGLHVVVPLKPTATYTAVRLHSRKIANQLVNENPELCTVEIRKKERAGKLFVDYLRNGFGATVVAPYAVRVHEGAPVATPLIWSEVKKGLSSQQYTIATIFRRLARRADPWANMSKSARSLE